MIIHSGGATAAAAAIHYIDMITMAVIASLPTIPPCSRTRLLIFPRRAWEKLIGLYGKYANADCTARALERACTCGRFSLLLTLLTFKVLKCSQRK